MSGPLVVLFVGLRLGLLAPLVRALIFGPVFALLVGPVVAMLRTLLGVLVVLLATLGALLGPLGLCLLGRRLSLPFGRGCTAWSSQLGREGPASDAL